MNLFELTKEEKISAAKVKLLREHPFFGYATLRVPVVLKSEESKVASPKIVIRDDVVERHDVSEVSAIIAHEIMHFLLKHHERQKEFRRYLQTAFPSEEIRHYHEKMNVAEDIVINAILVLEGFNLPDWVILPNSNGTVVLRDVRGREFVIEEAHKKSAEEVFLIIKDGEFSFNESIYYDPPAYFDPGETDDEEHQLDPSELLTKAYAYSVMHGKVPAGLGFLVKKILSPKVDWKHLLRRFFVKAVPFNYTYRKPNRKSPERIILPSVEYGYGLWRGVFAIDSSGSISDEVLEQFVSELYALSKEFFVDLTAIVCDAEIQQEVRIKSQRDVEKLIKLLGKKAGRGGTDFRPVFRKAEEYRPIFLVYLTDGYGDFPERSPKFPVLWVLYNSNAKVPFGQVIRVNG